MNKWGRMTWSQEMVSTKKETCSKNSEKTDVNRHVFQKDSCCWTCVGNGSEDKNGLLLKEGEYYIQIYKKFGDCI